ALDRLGQLELLALVGPFNDDQARHVTPSLTGSGLVLSGWKGGRWRPSVPPTVPPAGHGCQEKTRRRVPLGCDSGTLVENGGRLRKLLGMSETRPCPRPELPGGSHVAHPPVGSLSDRRRPRSPHPRPHEPAPPGRRSVPPPGGRRPRRCPRPPAVPGRRAGPARPR